MANMVLNTLEIIGNENDYKLIIDFFSNLENENKKDPYMGVSFFGDYIYDISLYGDFVLFETKYSPNFETLQNFLKSLKLNCKIKLSYENLDNHLLGVAFIDVELIHDVFVTDEEFETYYNDEDDDNSILLEILNKKMLNLTF